MSNQSKHTFLTALTVTWRFRSRVYLTTSRLSAGLSLILPLLEITSRVFFERDRVKRLITVFELSWMRRSMKRLSAVPVLARVITQVRVVGQPAKLGLTNWLPTRQHLPAVGRRAQRPCRASNLAYALRVYNATFSSDIRGTCFVDRLTVGRAEQTLSWHSFNFQ